MVQHRWDSFIRAMGATLEALIAAFCRLDKSLSCCWEKGWLVGAVGIEIAFVTCKSCWRRELYRPRPEIDFSPEEWSPVREIKGNHNRIIENR